MKLAILSILLSFTETGRWANTAHRQTRGGRVRHRCDNRQQEFVVVQMHAGPDG